MEKKRMKVNLNGNDFDTYNINIPVSSLLGKRRQDFLYQELDKRHPSFSDRFTYDEKLRFTLKGFVSEITVIDKLILGSYRAKYPSSSFKNQNGKTVFSGFSEKALFFILFFCVLSAFFYFYKSEVFEKENKFEVKKAVEDNAEIMIPEKINISGLYETLLSEIDYASGEIRSFSWGYDGYTENIAMEIIGCYPTELCTENRIEELSCSAVVFDKGRPSFTLGKKRKVFWEKKDSDDIGISLFSEKIRKILKDFQADTESESYSPFRIRFRVTDLEKVFGKNQASMLSALLEKSGYIISELKITKSGNQDWLCEMTFISGKEFPFSEDVVLSLEKKISLFEKHKESKTALKNMPVKIKTDRTDKKIAVIKHAGENEDIYYKNEKGRILHEEKN